MWKNNVQLKKKQTLEDLQETKIEVKIKTFKAGVDVEAYKIWS